MLLKITNQADGSADLYINGTIVDDEEGGIIADWCDNTDGFEWPLNIKRQLDILEDKRLNIYINSYGGSVAAGLAMAHMIERHKGETTAIVDGYCCSIATQIFFAADKCKIHENSYLMIHKPWSIAQGDANEMRKVAEILDTLQEGLETTYRKKALDTITAEKIHEMTEAETWLTGTEAKDIFDIELLDSSPALNCVGSMDKLKAIGAKKIPPSLNFLPENKMSVDDDLAEVEIALALAKGVI